MLNIIRIQTAIPSCMLLWHSDLCRFTTSLLYWIDLYLVAFEGLTLHQKI